MKSLKAKIGVTTHWDVYRKRAAREADSGPKIYSLSEWSSLRATPLQEHEIPPGIETLEGWPNSCNRSSSNHRGWEFGWLCTERHVIGGSTKLTIYFDGFSLFVVAAVVLNG